MSWQRPRLAACLTSSDAGLTPHPEDRSRRRARLGSRTTLATLRTPLNVTGGLTPAARRSEPPPRRHEAGAIEVRTPVHRAPKGPPRTVTPADTRRDSRRTNGLPTKGSAGVATDHDPLPPLDGDHISRRREAVALRDADERLATTLRPGAARCFEPLRPRPPEGESGRQGPHRPCTRSSLRDPHAVCPPELHGGVATSMPSTLPARPPRHPSSSPRPTPAA